MEPSGAHTHPGGGGTGAAVAVLALMIAAAFAKPLIHLIHVVVHAVDVLVQVLLIAAAVTVGAGVAAGAVFVAWKLRQARSPARPAPYTATVLPPRARQARPPVAGRQRPAVDRPAEVHLHLHGMTADEVAQAITRHHAPPGWPPPPEGGPE